jgi:beta-glucanase (GH16 family)
MRVAALTPIFVIFGLCGYAATPAPTISTTPAQNHAVIVTLATETPGAKIRYTVDGSAPTAGSQVYEAPFLVAADLTVTAIAIAADGTASPAASKSFTLHIPSGTLVWADEFTGRGGTNAQPDPKVWTYDTGNSGFGNQELEDYCAWGSTAAPCDPAAPNVFVGQDGYLHIVARQSATGAITSGRLKTQGLFSFQYGRFEIRARVPEGAGLWPAGWLLGNNAVTVGWPACGEMDVLERVNAAKTPDWNEGSIHGTGFVGNVGLGAVYHFPAGRTAADWHTYGMIWSKGSVAYYVDDPAHPYAIDTTDSIKHFPGAVWPFDDGQSSFIVLNLAVGGIWPGSPDASTPYPAEMVVDYVRVYTN